MSISEKKKVGVWLRVSTSMQVETESLEHHLARAEAYCQAKGWDIVETYRLEGLSGKNVMDYPQTIQMLADIASGKIDTLVFSSLSRLARNTKQLLAISDIFQQHDASLVSLKEAIDTTTPAGRMFFTVQSSLATFEAEETSERVKASVVTRAKMGKSLGGVASFGYRWNETKTALELDPNEAPIRKEAFKIFLECKRVKATARILNERGYRTRNGAKFSYCTVNNMLTNPIAKGLRRSNWSVTEGNKRTIKPESEWIYTEAPAVVSEEIFDAVQSIINKNKKTGAKKARLPVHPFSGVTYCCCNKENPVKMRVLSSTPDKYTCRACRAKIPTADLEEVYKAQLEKMVLSPRALSQYAKSVDKTLSEKQKQLEVARRQLSEALMKTEKYLELYVDGKLTKNAFGRYNDPLEEQISKLELTVPELENDIKTLKTTIAHDSKLAYDSESLYQKWDSLSSEEKTKLIASLTDKILICNETIEIDMRFIPSSINSGNLGMNQPPTSAIPEQV